MPKGDHATHQALAADHFPFLIIYAQHEADSTRPPFLDALPIGRVALALEAFVDDQMDRIREAARRDRDLFLAQTASHALAADSFAPSAFESRDFGRGASGPAPGQIGGRGQSRQSSDYLRLGGCPTAVCSSASTCLEGDDAAAADGACRRLAERTARTTRLTHSLNEERLFAAGSGLDGFDGQGSFDARIRRPRGFEPRPGSARPEREPRVAG